MSEGRRRRDRWPFVLCLAACWAGIGTGTLIGWLVMPDRQQQHTPVAITLGLAFGGAAVLTVVGLLLLRKRSSAP